jgi:hypothetical protein
VLGPVGAIMGHISRKKIKANDEEGDGMALAGVIVGWIATFIGLVIVALIVVFVVLAINSPDTSGYNYDYDTY